MNWTKRIALLLAILLFALPMTACLAPQPTGGTTKATKPTATSDDPASRTPFSGMSAPIEDFVITHDGSTIAQRAAYDVRDAIKKVTKLELEVLRRDQTEAVTQIALEEDTAIDDGAWTLAAEGDRISVCAGDYYGFADVARYFREAADKNAVYPFCDGFTEDGRYTDHAKGVFTSTKYVYDRQGDIRVMFNNVLFGDTATSWDGTIPYSVPAEARNELQALMVAEYMPDVLGCQEFDKTKRGTGNSGAGGLAGLLSELGYVEAVDPRVQNAYETNQKIPDTDASLTVEGAEPGTLISGYGTKNATNIDYNGIKKTYYNCTPLFYNPETTALIDADYYWYKSQWDRISEEKRDTAPSAWSKSATWGVFEDLATGECYIVVSTHMCTRSNYVRGLQAKELIALIDRITVEYDYPVFLGGDMNGNLGDANYDYFVSGEVGYTSLQDSKIASVYTSNINSMHDYPDFDADLGFMTPGKNDENMLGLAVQETNKNSIDQILLSDTERIRVGVFGVVVDDMALSASDHLPIFADFSFR